MAQEASGVWPASSEYHSHRIFDQNQITGHPESQGSLDDVVWPCAQKEKECITEFLFHTKDADVLCALVRGHSGSMGWRRSKRCLEQALCIQVQMEEFRALPWVPQDALGPSTVRGYLMDRTPGRNLISQAVAEVGGELACVCGPLPTVARRPRIPNTCPGSILVGRNGPRIPNTRPGSILVGRSGPCIPNTRPGMPSPGGSS